MSDDELCNYAEEILSKIKNPDKRSVNAIRIRRKWIKGEISEREMFTAQHEALNASQYTGRFMPWYRNRYAYKSIAYAIRGNVRLATVYAERFMKGKG